MGWKGEGFGLGKSQQGIAEAIQIQDLNNTRFGLGFNFYDDDDDEKNDPAPVKSGSADAQTTIHAEDTVVSSAATSSSATTVRVEKATPSSNNKRYAKPRPNELLRNMRQILINFVNSPSENDLLFDKNLTIEDRKLIHREAHKLGLKTRSEGSATNRFIVVRKNLTADQILEAALKNGGQVSRYQIVSKGSQNNDA
jgi:hypothetical protein